MTQTEAGGVPAVQPEVEDSSSKASRASKAFPLSEADRATQVASWKLVQELDTELALYREMAIQLAGWQLVQVPDCVRDPNLGLGQEECGQLREWLASLLRSVTSERMLTMKAAVETQVVANVLRRAEKGDDG